MEDALKVRLKAEVLENRSVRRTKGWGFSYVLRGVFLKQTRANLLAQGDPILPEKRRRFSRLLSSSQAILLITQRLGGTCDSQVLCVRPVARHTDPEPARGLVPQKGHSALESGRTEPQRFRSDAPQSPPRS